MIPMNPPRDRIRHDRGWHADWRFHQLHRPRPIKALLWPAVVNGVIAVPLMISPAIDFKRELELRHRWLKIALAAR